MLQTQRDFIKEQMNTDAVASEIEGFLSARLQELDLALVSVFRSQSDLQLEVERLIAGSHDNLEKDQRNSNLKS